MKPVKISKNEFGPHSNGVEVIYAESQPEYIPLPVVRFPDGTVVSKWKLWKEERDQFAEEGVIYLCQLTFNEKLQPVLLGTSIEGIFG